MTSTNLVLLLRKIHDENLSRNKNYALFEDQEYKRAHRIHHYLQRATRLIKKHPNPQVTVRQVDGRERRPVELMIAIPELKFSWSMFLSVAEYGFFKRLGREVELELSEGIDLGTLQRTN